MSRYEKPYRAIPQQIELLMSRGMVIDQPQQAAECLQRVGYYRLSAYWYPFRQSRDNPSGKPQKFIRDEFQPNTTFTAVFNLYVFDKKLRLLMLDALERIEIAIRTDVALIIGKHAPAAHRDPMKLHERFSQLVRTRKNGNKSTDHEDWLRKLNEVERRSSADFVKHFRLKYPASNMPIWISIELWDFGMLSRFFSGMRIEDQIALASRYGIPRADLLESWLRMLNYVRNVCAHHARLWNQPLVDQPKPHGHGSIPLLDHLADNAFAQGRFYAAAAITRYLLRIINPSTSWAARLKDLITTFPAHPCAEFKRSGFPVNWETEALWQSSS